MSLDLAFLWPSVRNTPMPKAATAPFPRVSTSEAPRTARQAAWRAQPIESRVSALEARWDETTPTLAKISDLRGVEIRLIKWILSAAGGVLLALFGIFFSGYNVLNGRVDWVVSELRAEIKAELRETNARLDSVNVRLDSAVSELRTEFKEELRETNARMEALSEKIDTRFEKIDARFEKIDARFEKMDERLEKMEAKMDAKFEKMDERFEKMDAKFDAMMEELRAQRSNAR